MDPEGSSIQSRGGNGLADGAPRHAPGWMYGRQRALGFIRHHPQGSNQSRSRPYAAGFCTEPRRSTTFCPFASQLEEWVPLLVLYKGRWPVFTADLGSSGTMLGAEHDVLAANGQSVGSLDRQGALSSTTRLGQGWLLLYGIGAERSWTHDTPPEAHSSEGKSSNP